MYAHFWEILVLENCLEDEFLLNQTWKAIYKGNIEGRQKKSDLEPKIHGMEKNQPVNLMGNSAQNLKYCFEVKLHTKA